MQSIKTQKRNNWKKKLFPLGPHAAEIEIILRAERLNRLRLDFHHLKSINPIWTWTSFPWKFEKKMFCQFYFLINSSCDMKFSESKKFQKHVSLSVEFTVRRKIPSVPIKTTHDWHPIENLFCEVLKMDLTKELRESLPWFWMDQSLLIQVWLTIWGNIIKYSNNNPRRCLIF